MNKENTPEELKWIRWRYAGVVIIFFTIMLLGILVSALHIQLVEGSYWSAWKDKQTRDSVLVAPQRGNIFSDDGALMATSVPVYALYMDFRVYEDPGIRGDQEKIQQARQEYADTLRRFIKPLSEGLSKYFPNKTPDEISKSIWNGFNKGSREYLLDKKRVSYFEWKEIQELPFFDRGRNVSGLYTKKYVVRSKMFGSLASRTIGDLYPEAGKGGKSGLELAYDTLLSGKPGLCSRRNVAGRYMDVIEVPPVNGCDLHTTINLPIQDIVETALLKELIKTDAASGTAVLMEVKTGRVRAISNLGKTERGYAETQNYAASDLSEPGSTFKTIAMMAALEEGRIKPNDKVDTGNGQKIIHGQVMTDHNHNKGGYGVITAAQSIWYSSNIGMGVLVDEGFHGIKNADVFVDRILKMGFGKDLHLEIPGAATPRYKHPKSKDSYWAATDLPWMATGYVVRIPPMYTLAYYNAIANDGCYIRPYFVDKITRENEVVKKFSTEVMTQKICSDKTLRDIHAMLDSVVISGTGRSSIKSDIVSISGKTGTAVLSKGKDGYKAGGKNYQVSFCGYFPSQEPKYTCIVVIRDPQNGYASGSTMAGGVFKRIAEQVYSSELQVALEDVASIDSMYPKVKSGFAAETQYLLKDLSIPYHLETQMPEAILVQQSFEKQVDMSMRDMQPKVVPNVLGLGLRDALCVLERAGLQVHVTGGEGRVVQQSLREGSNFRRGNEIYIRLND